MFEKLSYFKYFDVVYEIGSYFDVHLFSVFDSVYKLCYFKGFHVVYEIYSYLMYIY